MKSVLPLLGFLLLGVALTHAAPLPEALAPADLDLPACQLLRGAEVEPLDPESVGSLFGFGEAGEKTKKARGPKPGKDEVPPQYLLVFKKPIAIGTVLGATGELRLHRPGAPLPANPANPSDWLTVEVPPSQSFPAFAPLPAGTKTRAVLATLPLRREGVPYLRLLTPRLANYTPAGTANAESEWTTEPMLSPPYTYDAGHLVRGYNAWINSGKNGKGINARAPISDVAPTWVLLSWPEKRRVEGVLLQDNFEKLELQTFAGPAGINPAAATEAEWKTLRKFQQTVENGLRWITFAPEETRALRLRITKVSGTEPAVAKLSSFLTFADLGQEPAPIFTRVTQTEPPVKIPFRLAQEGQITLVVESADGRRVRNVVANVQGKAGSNVVAWDLRDESGNYVAPGRYQWRAITHPPLEFRYEMTAYPNITTHFPERTAWLNGPDGPGGWLADHTPPKTVCTTGDRVFIGAPVAESGVSLIECDLERRKLWGHHSFEGFTGCNMLSTDGRTLFNTMGADNFGARAGLDKKTEAIWAVDLQSRQVRTLAMLQPTAERKRGIQGFAARDNKVYLAIHAPDNWLNNAVAAVDVDVLNCLPAYPKARAERAAHEIVPDPRTDFLRLFRLKETPPGQLLPFLETTKTADAQQHIVLALSKPVAVGSIVFPPPLKEEKVQFQISVLKPNAPYPPRVHEKNDWQVVPMGDKSAWAVVPLPPNTTTRALRFTFLKGGVGSADDLLADVEDKKGAPSLDQVEALGSKKGGLGSEEGLWMRKIEGVKLLNRRFENLYSSATIRTNSGKVAADGTWDAQRSEPLSPAAPAIYALEWKMAQTVRGLALKEIDGAVTEIDVYNGDATKPIDISAAEGWKNVGTYEQPLRNYYQGDQTWNPKARYLDGYVDFGREVSTRAVRLRVVKQWDTKQHYPSGVREDQGGQELDPKRCHVYGVAPLKYLGGEEKVDSLVTERLEVLDGGTGKIIQELPLPGAGTRGGQPARGNTLVFNGAGELFTISDNKLARVELPSGRVQTLASDLVEPTTIACAPTGELLVYDAAPDRNTVRVYDATGKFLRTVGQPGLRQRGPWVPEKLQYVSGLTVDAKGQIWAVENQYWPKRVTIWSKEGVFQKEFTGPTEYGGGGCLDPSDKRRLFYGPLEFELDWATGKTRLKNLTSLNGWDTSDAPRIVHNELYLVNTKPVNNPNFGLIYKYEQDHARLVGCVGIAGYCKPMLDPKLVNAFGGKVLIDYDCAWSDLNGDEQVQPEEVQLWPKESERGTPVTFDNQLNAQFGQVGLRVKRWLPNGVPVYERVDYPGLWKGWTLGLDNGNFYHFEDQKADALAAQLKPDGTPVWTYKTEGSGGHALNRAQPMHDGQLVAELGLAGHATAHAGDLGEFLVFNSNFGIFNIMTADGLFAGQLFRDIRDRDARNWSRPDTARGMLLDRETPGQEHFNGYFCRTSDNHYYAVIGHNHASVVEVLGLDKFKRISGSIDVDAKALNQTQEWERERETRQVYARAPVIDCYRLQAPPKLDGQLNDWPFVSAELDDNARFRIGYDTENLYVAYEIARRGPLKNKGQQWDRLFKTGASVDLQIGVDPAAAPERKAAGAGDERLLLTFMGEEPTAVLYQAVVPGTPPEKAWQAVSPVAAVSFDRVAKLEKPKMVSSGGDNRYVVEAAIPLSTLGLKITPGLRLKFDWGVLTSGPEGTEVLRREYWANKATQITADVPSEAELRPQLWGHIRFHEETAGSHLDPTAAKGDRKLDDLLNDLK